MSTRTRRLVFLSVILAALLLPAETILLRALVTPQQSEAVKQWVAELDDVELAESASQVQFYPLAYRREIMARLTPSGRSDVWRAHVKGYLTAHPELDAATQALLATTIEVLSPALFTDPTEARRASLHAVAAQIEAALGREEAEYLLYRLGPRDGTFASFEPLAMSLSNKVRGLFQAYAAAAPDCECTMNWGCFSYTTTCSQFMWCLTDDQWPMCGWGWMDVCDGLCLYGY